MEYLCLRFRIQFREIIEVSPKMLLFLFSFSGFAGCFFKQRLKMLQMLKIILLVFCRKKTIDSVIKFIDCVIHETHWWHSHFALWTNIPGLELFIRFPETKFGIVPCKNRARVWDTQRGTWWLWVWTWACLLQTSDLLPQEWMRMCRAGEKEMKREKKEWGVAHSSRTPVINVL